MGKEEAMKLPVKYRGLTIQQKREVREEYIRLQGGKCLHCGNPLDGKATQEILDHWIDESLFPPNFLQHPVHLHHCHETGLTIGAIHCHCNAVLWQYHGE